MADQNEEGTEADGAGGTDDEAFEVEAVVTRAEAAAVLRRLADGVASGSVELGEGEVEAAVPDLIEVEIEYERDDGEVELEAELEWPVDDEVGDIEAESEDLSEATSDDVDGDRSTDEAKGEAEASDTRDSLVEIVGHGETESKARFELYRDNAGEWRWRLVHDNGNVIADGGEGYDRKATARNGLESVKSNAKGAPVTVRDD